MLIRDLLDKQTKNELIHISKKKKKKKKIKMKKVPRVKEYSTREIEELMDIRKPTYKKVNGKIKQR